MEALDSLEKMWKQWVVGLEARLQAQAEEQQLISLVLLATPAHLEGRQALLASREAIHGKLEEARIELARMKAGLHLLAQLRGYRQHFGFE